MAYKFVNESSGQKMGENFLQVKISGYMAYIALISIFFEYYVKKKQTMYCFGPVKCVLH